MAPRRGNTAGVTPSDRSPYAAYAAIIGVFGGLVGVNAALEKRSSSRPAVSPFDLALLGAASFKAARAISRERVGSVLREPFVEDPEAAARPAGDGMRRALGELVTCTRCMGTWSAAGLLTVQNAAPRFGRALTWTLAAAAVNDFLHAGFAALCSLSNRRA